MNRSRVQFSSTAQALPFQAGLFVARVLHMTDYVHSDVLPPHLVPVPRIIEKIPRDHSGDETQFDPVYCTRYTCVEEICKSEGECDEHSNLG